MLAVAETWENGKPIRETLAADMPLASTTSATSRARSARRRARSPRSTATRSPTTSTSRWASSARSSRGTSRSSWPTWKLAPALAAGNCVVLKPAEQTPGLDPRAHGAHRRPAAARACSTWSTGSASRRASRWRRRPRIRKIAFTGETTTGRLIMQYAVAEHHPGDPRAGRQEPEPVLRGRRPREGRLLRQGARGLRDVRLQPGRGLHLPVARAHPGVDLRRVHGRRRSRAPRRSSRATRSTPRR